MGRCAAGMQGKLATTGLGQPDPADGGWADRQGKAEMAGFPALWFLRKQGLQSFRPTPRSWARPSRDGLVIRASQAGRFIEGDYR